MTRVRDERGAVEALPVAMLLLVAGTLLLADAWAVLDTKLAVEQAAREGGRVAVEASDRRTAAPAARRAAALSFVGSGRDAGRLEVAADGRWRHRCALLEVRASTSVRTIRLPIIGSFGPPVTVHGRHREVLDPFRSDLRGEACDG